MSDLGLGDLSPVLQVVQKRQRACKKKLTRIQELEAVQASGKELTPEQLPILKSKEAQLLICQELAKVDEGLRSALKEEHMQALTKGEAQGREIGAAEAAKLLSEIETKHSEHLQEALARSDAEWQARLDAAVAKATQDATKAAEEKHAALLREPLSADNPLKPWLLGQIRSLLQLFYFSQLFDTWRNYWLAPVEVQACLGYDRQIDTKDGEPHLGEVDLIHLAFFGRTLVDRMTEPLSHEQCLDKAVQAAGAWLCDKDAVAIPSPPAMNNITMGELQAKLNRILASPFCQVKPSVPAGPTPGASFPAEPPLPPGVHAPQHNAARPPAAVGPAAGPPAAHPASNPHQQQIGRVPPPGIGAARALSGSRSDSPAPAPAPAASRSPAPPGAFTGSNTPGFLDTAPVGPNTAGGAGQPGNTQNYRTAGGPLAGVQAKPTQEPAQPRTAQGEAAGGQGGANVLKGLFTLSATGAPVPLVQGGDNTAMASGNTTNSAATPANTGNPVNSLLKQQGQAWEPSWRRQA